MLAEKIKKYILHWRTKLAVVIIALFIGLGAFAATQISLDSPATLPSDI
ncbi:hypothetical protein [Glaciecola sp. 1036]